MPETQAALKSDRFTVEQGTRLLVQVPQAEAKRLLDAILEQEALPWGDYDQVAFVSASGLQQFRSKPGGVNRATQQAVEVGCVEVQVFVAKTGAALEPVLRAIYHAHPYEEPVIQLIPAARTRHIRGQDEGNPNRFWNRETPDWVPPAHRG